jgi:hypothetical protein
MPDQKTKPNRPPALPRPATPAAAAAPAADPIQLAAHLRRIRCALRRSEPADHPAGVPYLTGLRSATWATDPTARALLESLKDLQLTAQVDTQTAAVTLILKPAPAPKPAPTPAQTDDQI